MIDLPSPFVSWSVNFFQLFLPDFPALVTSDFMQVLCFLDFSRSSFTVLEFFFRKHGLFFPLLGAAPPRLRPVSQGFVLFFFSSFLQVFFFSLSHLATFRRLLLVEKRGPSGTSGEDTRLFSDCSPTLFFCEFLARAFGGPEDHVRICVSPPRQSFARFPSFFFLRTAFSHSFLPRSWARHRRRLFEGIGISPFLDYSSWSLISTFSRSARHRSGKKARFDSRGLLLSNYLLLRLPHPPLPPQRGDPFPLFHVFTEQGALANHIFAREPPLVIFPFGVRRLPPLRDCP